MAVLTHGVRATAHRITGLSSLLGRSLVGLSRTRDGYLVGQERHDRLLLAVQILYACLFGGWFVYSKTWPAPDIVALFLFCSRFWPLEA
ncbi:MAG TPA: hypothetical protein VK821_19035 [Dehalococcoidia bacterium]|nr:hypothetical protein [Dehalococcoidia bacterium]